MMLTVYGGCLIKQQSQVQANQENISPPKQKFLPISTVVSFCTLRWYYQKTLE